MTTIERYRACAKIDPAEARPGRIVCRNDGIRIHPIKGGFRHDIGEIKEAAAVYRYAERHDLL